MVLLAQVLAQSGREDEADKLADQALVVDPMHPGAHLRKALKLQKSGKKDEALNHYRVCLAAEPNNASAWFSLGTLMQEAGKTVEAEDCYTTSIKTGKASYPSSISGTRRL